MQGRERGGLQGKKDTFPCIHAYGIWGPETAAADLKSPTGWWSLDRRVCVCVWSAVATSSETPVFWMVLSGEHLPLLVLSHVSASYTQGHPGLGLRSRHDQSCQRDVNNIALTSTIFGQSHVQDEGAGWLVVQLPTNCNRSSFIIVSGSRNNTLHLWSRARQSGIVWEVLRSWHTQEGKRGAAHGYSGSFPPSLQRQKWDFPQGSDCVGVILT